MFFFFFFFQCPFICHLLYLLTMREHGEFSTKWLKLYMSVNATLEHEHVICLFF